MPRYRVKFSGPVAPGIVEWLKHLIPVLREAPEDIEVDVEISHREESRDPDRLDGAG